MRCKQWQKEQSRDYLGKFVTIKNEACIYQVIDAIQESGFVLVKDMGAGITTVKKIKISDLCIKPSIKESDL